MANRETQTLKQAFMVFAAVKTLINKFGGDLKVPAELQMAELAAKKLRDTDKLAAAKLLKEVTVRLKAVATAFYVGSPRHFLGEIRNVSHEFDPDLLNVLLGIQEAYVARVMARPPLDFAIGHYLAMKTTLAAAIAKAKEEQAVRRLQQNSMAVQAAIETKRKEAEKLRADRATAQKAKEERKEAERHRLLNLIGRNVAA